MAAAASPADLAAKVPQVREKFLAKFNGSILDDTYDSADVKWVKTSDPFIRCALKAHKTGGDVNKAVELLNEILVFRAKYKASSLKESDLNPEFLKANAVFFHGVDKKGQKVLNFRLSLVKKGQFSMEDQKKAIVYIFNQHYSVDPEVQIVTLFDCTDAGINNLDVELSKFIIVCNDTYFPQLVDYGLMFKMPKALEVVYSIIRSFMNAEQKENTHIVSRKNVQTYIAEDQLLPHQLKEDKN